MPTVGRSAKCLKEYSLTSDNEVFVSNSKFQDFALSYQLHAFFVDGRSRMYVQSAPKLHVKCLAAQTLARPSGARDSKFRPAKSSK
jgi:hypothetical protein